MARQKRDDQLEHTSSSYVRIWDVALKTYQRRWTIEMVREGSGISVLAARHDDDDDSQFLTNFYDFRFKSTTTAAIGIHPTKAWLNSSIWPIDGILKGSTTLSQSRPGSNGNEGILHIPQSSKTRASPSDSLVSYLDHSWNGRVLPPLQRCSQLILQPQLTELNYMNRIKRKKKKLKNFKSRILSSHSLSHELVSTVKSLNS